MRTPCPPSNSQLQRSGYSVEASSVKLPHSSTKTEPNTSNPSVKSNKEKLAFIDALRGLAALMVVACHVAYIPIPNLDAAPALLRLANSGKAGVVLFFMISAFTLCLSFEVRKSNFTPAQTRDFYLRRLFRILPLYLVSIPIAWVRDLVAFNYARPIPEALWRSLSIFIPNDYQGLVWASWTLGVELLFYLLFPFVFRICNTLRRSLYGLAVSILTDLVASNLIASHVDAHLPLGLNDYRNQILSHLDSDIRFSLLHNLQFFMLGIVFYYLYRDYVITGSLNKKTGRILGIIGISAFVSFVFFYPRSIETVLYGHNLLIGISFFLFALGCSVYPSRLVVNRWLVSLGLISYSLYLLHPPIIALFFSLYSRIYELTLPASISYMFCLTITLAILIPASVLTFKWIEKPGMDFGKSIIKAL
jgi:peptidoglycan/LPS O-acetylase OafA/YrhL